MNSSQVEQLDLQTPPYSNVDCQARPTADTKNGQLPTACPIMTRPSEIEVHPEPELQRHRQQVFCRSCRQLVVTRTEYRVGGGTWCMCCVVFFVGGLLCCFIPFLMKSCKDVVHRCPTCAAVIGRKPLV